MSQVIDRSTLASAAFVRGLAHGEGAPTLIWVVDPALTAPGAGPGPLSTIAAELDAAGLRSLAAETTFPREPRVAQVDALAAEIRAVSNPIVIAVGGGSTAIAEHVPSITFLHHGRSSASTHIAQTIQF